MTGMARMLAIMGVLGVMLLGFTPSAQAAQNGQQTVQVTSASWSAVSVLFACGNSFVVPVGAVWGENYPMPRCGNYVYEAEPHSVWVGPGWCVSRWITDTTGYAYGKQVLSGGGAGKMWRIWWQGVGSQDDYRNHIESWYGGDCPTRGAGIQWGYNYP